MPDPSRVTLQQLAPVPHLQHNGTAGQAFELAVADAVTAQDPEVTGLIRAGLRRLNLSGDGPLKHVGGFLGMEKVPLEQRDDFWGQVLEVLPPGGRFRTGRPGRPPNAATAIERLAASTARSLRRPKPLAGTRTRGGWPTVRAGPAQPTGPGGRAGDVRFGPGGGVAENQPLACAQGGVARRAVVAHGRPRRGGRGRRSASSPRVTVTLPADGWFSVFRDALGRSTRH